MSLETIETSNTALSTGTANIGTDLLDALVKDRLLSLEQARLIGEQQRIAANGRSREIIELVLENGFVNKASISQTLSRMGAGLSAELQLLLPREMCHKYQIIPINRLEVDGKSVLVIETAKTFSVSELQAIETEASKYCDGAVAIRVVAATQARMHEAIRKLAGKTNGVAEAIHQLELDPENGSKLKTMVNEVLMEAVSLRASDAHFDCLHDRAQQCFVSYRIDGVLRRMHLLPPRIMLSMLRTLKTQAEMDASDSRSFQDGRMDFNFQSPLQRDVGWRVPCHSILGPRVTAKPRRFDALPPGHHTRVGGFESQQVEGKRPFACHGAHRLWQDYNPVCIDHGNAARRDQRHDHRRSGGICDFIRKTDCFQQPDLQIVFGVNAIIAALRSQRRGGGRASGRGDR